MVEGSPESGLSCPFGRVWTAPAGLQMAEGIDGMRRAASDAAYREVPKSSTCSEPKKEADHARS